MGRVRVRVESSARLHLGFYNLWGIRAYGSIGVMIDKPRVIVEAEPADSIEIVNKTRIPVEREVRFVLERLRVDNIRITILEAIPRHVGLGSTTQLMLSVAMATNKLKNLGLTVREAAALLGRGRVSGIGVGVFERGGFIVDSGRRLSNGRLTPISSPHDIPGVIFHHSLPRDRVFLIIIPSGPRGLAEDEEWKYLSKPLGETGEANHKLHEILLEKMLPGIIEENPHDFGEALTTIQAIVGEYFSRVQHGVYSNKVSERLAAILRENGALAVGQSSWGPTIYGFYNNASEAKEAKKLITEIAEEQNIPLTNIYVAHARNRGSRITCASGS
jgi:beta-ribofuranosylaminobenzene 5'-phosphate synthase